MDKTTGNYGYGYPPAYSIDNQPLPPSAPTSAPSAPSAYSAQQSQQVVVVRSDQVQLQAVPLVQSYVSHIILACFTFWCCGCLCGLLAFIFAGYFTTDVVYYTD